MIDLKTGLIILVLLVVGVYLGNMWSHKMIQQEMEKKQKDLQAAQQALLAAQAGA